MTLSLSRAEMIERMVTSDKVYDGKFIVAVKTTHIYCLPSCRPARKPKPENVEFYETPQEAQVAGFRACKLCCPDNFYNGGYYADELLIENLVEKINANPGAFANVGALAMAANISLSKLHELFRTYYHTTPADFLTRARINAARQALLHDEQQVSEIAFEVGFESLSAFNENFRKYSAMSPLKYRYLKKQLEFDLNLPADYPVERILKYLGRDQQSLTDRVENSVYKVCFRLERHLYSECGIIVEAKFEQNNVHCRIIAKHELSGAAIKVIHERLLAALGLTTDPMRFEAQVASSPQLAALINGQKGLRLPLISDPFDGMIWAIIGQQINLAFAYNLRHRLIELTSHEFADGLYLPPAPEDIAKLEPEDLTPLQFSKAKANYLIGVARAVVDGSLPLYSLADKSATRIERTLLKQRGIGPWSAHYIMMRSFGLLDCVLVGDSGLAASLTRFFELETRPNHDQTINLMNYFSPYRSLATFHFWQRLGMGA